MEGNHHLSIGSAVTGNMSREIVDIVHQLGLILLGGGTADTLTQGNADAGRLSLEGAQNQKILFQFVKACPVDIRQVLPQQSGGVGQVGNFIGHPVRQGHQPLGDEFVINFHCKDLLIYSINTAHTRITVLPAFGILPIIQGSA